MQLTEGYVVTPVPRFSVPGRVKLREKRTTITQLENMLEGNLEIWIADINQGKYRRFPGNVTKVQAWALYKTMSFLTALG